MKLLFSLLLYFLTQNCFASRIQVLYQEGSELHAKAIESIFMNRYKIPQELIRLKKMDNCVGTDKRYLELCVTKDANIWVLPNKNIELIKSSFTVFYKGFKNAI